MYSFLSIVSFIREHLTFFFLNFHTNRCYIFRFMSKRFMDRKVSENFMRGRD